MRKILPWLFASVGLFLIILSVFFWSNDLITTSCVARIDIDGPIMAKGTPPTLTSPGQPGADDIVRTIKNIEKDDHYKAILIVVSSPGGEVVASNELYRAIKHSRKPVVVYIKDMGASGAYYLSLGADRIIAHPDAITGSVGVKLSVMNFYGLMEKLGIREYTYSKGEMKDMLSPFKSNYSEEEQEVVNELIDQVYNEFVQTVKENRPNVNPVVFSSRIFTGKQALEYGLIDDIGTLEDAIALAARLGGVEDNSVCEIHVSPSGASPFGTRVTLQYRCC